MPILVTSDGFTIIESDCIARYLLDKYKDLPPHFNGRELYERSLSDQICRVHDIYISPIQVVMS
jgi:glutathione S-transferase